MVQKASCFPSRLGFTLNSLIQLYCELGDKTPPTKIASLSMMVMSFLCFAFYQADLMSILTAGKKAKMVSSFEEALDEGYRQGRIHVNLTIFDRHRSN